MRRGGDPGQGARRAPRGARPGRRRRLGLRRASARSSGTRPSSSGCAPGPSSSASPTGCGSPARWAAPHWMPRTRAPTSSSPRRGARRTAWPSPRRWRAASRCWRPGSAACPEALGRAPGGRRPGILVPPDDPGRSPGRSQQWLGDPAAARRTCAPRPSERRPPLPTWSATSAEVARVLTAVAALTDPGSGEPGRPRPVCSGEQVLRPRRGEPRRPGGRDRRDVVEVGASAGRRARARCARRRARHRPVPRGAARHRRPSAGGRRRSSPCVTTLCGAWRWRLVARRLGADLTLAGALASCYRAQFLNVTLPGGVLGDVGRGVQHGRVGGDVGRGLRGVAWERTAGQVVLAVLTGAALLVSPARSTCPGSAARRPTVVGVLLVAVAVAVAVVARMRGHRATRLGAPRGRRPARAAARPGIRGHRRRLGGRRRPGTSPRSCSPPARSGCAPP